MLEPTQSQPATVPEQPEAKPPLKKGMPVVIALVAIIALIGIANLSSLVSGNKKAAPASALPMRPATANPQQVSSFETQQQMQARRDAEERQHQLELAAAMQQLQAAQGVPGPEADGTPAMTAAQRAAIYGDSPNAPKQTSNASQAQAEAKQKALAREKQQQDAINSDTVAIDFSHSGGTALSTNAPQIALANPDSATSDVASAPDNGNNGERPGSVQVTTAQEPKSDSKSNPMAGYDFDSYQGQLYRIFEGTVFEGVVTNHIDGGLSGPILVMLTTDYYSHDHQQLLMPQGTRLIGTVQSVSNAQQRKMFVTFHRAMCPDGFSLDFDKYVGLDPLGTTGLATKVDHGYLRHLPRLLPWVVLAAWHRSVITAASFTPSTEIRNGISAQTAAGGRADPQSLPQSSACDHAKRGLTCPRLRRQGHFHPVL